VYGQAPHVRVCHAWDVGTSRGKLFKMLKDLPHFLRKPRRYVGAPFPIPVRGFAQFRSCSRSKSYGCQRESTSL